LRKDGTSTLYFKIGGEIFFSQKTAVNLCPVLERVFPKQIIEAKWVDPAIV
jgi:hypothetical protein